jgi:hypothetical protein
MSTRKPTPPPTLEERKTYIQELKSNIGRIGTTYFSPTYKARLTSVEKDKCWFVVTEAGEDGIEKYNSAVGQTFYLPLKSRPSINFDF